jgi:hypothetical protein
MSRLSASCAVSAAASAAVSSCSRLAASASAWTTSIGASPPASTRIWLSSTSLRARSGDRFVERDRRRRRDVAGRLRVQRRDETGQARENDDPGARGEMTDHA